LYSGSSVTPVQIFFVGVPEREKKEPKKKMSNGKREWKGRKSQTKCFEDLQQLILFGGSREEWPTIDHFSKDAAHTPDVHRCVVLARAHQNVKERDTKG
jgi:hypothetical protein